LWGMDSHYAPPRIIIQAERLWNITKAHGFQSWFTRCDEKVTTLFAESKKGCFE